MPTIPSPENRLEIIRVKDLCVDFKQHGNVFRAVDRLCFSLYRGQALALVGESGSGKSLTSLAIMGLLPANALTTGEILFYDHAKGPVNLLQLRERDLRTWRGKRIGMIFQEPMTALNPMMRCGNQVMEALGGKVDRSMAKQRVIGLLDEVMLPDPERIFRAYPHQLSGGQKQRILVAMALAGDPDILIADEPTSALDASLVNSLLELLNQIRHSRKLSLLFITHDLNLLPHIADEVVVMRKGVEVESGTVTRVFDNPSQAYTCALLACRPPVDKRPFHLPVIGDFETRRVRTSATIETTRERDDRLKPIYAKPPFIRVESLLKAYQASGSNKSFVAVDRVSFDIYKGETLGLVGESGSGKTTLGRAMLRLQQPDGGKVIFEDIDLNQMKNSSLRKFRKHIQIIFQDPYASLNPRQTVGEAILEPMRIFGLHDNERQRAKTKDMLLHSVGLTARASSKYPHEFSGGQRQRICIARALAVEPDFMICDESVSALDVSVQAQILNLLNDLKRQHALTYLFITHDLAVVRYMSDRILVMKQGKIVEQNDTDRLFASPQHPYTQSLIQTL